MAIQSGFIVLRSEPSASRLIKKNACVIMIQLEPNRFSRRFVKYANNLIARLVQMYRYVNDESAECNRET